MTAPGDVIGRSDDWRAVDLDTRNHVTVPDPRPCWHCSASTRWVELSFEVPLCPGPCTEAKWAEYAAACGQVG